MELSNMPIGTQSRTGQGSGTLAEVSIEAKIEGFSHFVKRAHRDGGSHPWERGLFFERRVIALRRGVGPFAQVVGWEMGASRV